MVNKHEKIVLEATQNVDLILGKRKCVKKSVARNRASWRTIVDRTILGRCALSWVGQQERESQSLIGLASSDPAIEFVVLHCALYQSRDCCRTPSWWGMSPASLWHAPAIVSYQPSPPSGCSIRCTAQRALGSYFSFEIPIGWVRRRKQYIDAANWSIQIGAVRVVFEVT